MYDTKGFCIRPRFEHFLWDTGVPRHPEITNNLLYSHTNKGIPTTCSVYGFSLNMSSIFLPFRGSATPLLLLCQSHQGRRRWPCYCQNNPANHLGYKSISMARLTAQQYKVALHWPSLPTQRPENRSHQSRST